MVARLERTVTLLMLGRLRYGDIDTICRIRNVSSGGMRIDTGTPLHKGDKVAVEARSGICVEGYIAWTSQLAAGVAFSKAVDHRALIVPPTDPSGTRVVARSPRFRASATARLDIGARALRLRLVDISLGGCRVASEKSLPREIEGFLAIPGLPPLACASRWTNGDGAGLIFPTRIQFADFACWLERREFRFSPDPMGEESATGEGEATALAAPESLPFSRPRSS